MAFQAIDQEVNAENSSHQFVEPIYENVEEANVDENEIESVEKPSKAEPYYQIPKPQEPYYEVPKNPRPVPLYENVGNMYSPTEMIKDFGDSDGVDDGTEMVFEIDQSKYLIMEPPKEKPPPPPVDEPPSLLMTQTKTTSEVKIVDQNFKRINSTKRIKKEIRNKRSSFLGIEGQDFDDYSLELSVAPPPNMAALLKEEKRLEKQLYERVGLYENSDNGEFLSCQKFENFDGFHNVVLCR
jgi:F-box protein 20